MIFKIDENILKVYDESTEEWGDIKIKKLRDNTLVLVYEDDIDGDLTMFYIRI